MIFLPSRCDDFVTFCSYQRQFFLSSRLSPPGSSEPSCCDALFNPRPTFATTGTCYTTNVNITEKLPSSYSSLMIYVDAREDITPEYQMRLVANEAAARKGMYWTVSSRDHPPTVLMADQKRAASGTISIIGIRQSEVRRRFGCGRKKK